MAVVGKDRWNKSVFAGVITSMHILPTNGWFSGFRRFLTNGVTLTLIGILLLALIVPIAHDRLRQHEVAVAVRELFQLQPGTASSKEVIAFAQRHGLIAFRKFEGTYVNDPCHGSDCAFEGAVQSDRFINWVTTKGSDLTGIKAAWFEALKVRPWVVRFIVTIEQGRLEGSTLIFRNHPTHTTTSIRRLVVEPSVCRAHS
jgi:hypothetical protein